MTDIPERLPRLPLRVGVLLNSLDQPAWIRRVLEEIRASPVAELALVVRSADQQSPGLLALAWEYRRQLLPLLYDRLDARLVRRLRRPDAFAMGSIADLVAGCQMVEVRPRRTKYSDYFSDEDVESILRHDLDVALRFGFRILRGRALEIARHGVWSYHHGDNLVNRGGPNSFWEVMEAWPTTGSVLQALTEDLDNGRVLYRSHSSTNPLSLSLSRNPHYWKSAEFVSRRLRDLHELGPAGLQEDPLGREYTPYSEPLRRRPTNLRTIPLLTRLGARQLSSLASRARGRPRWSIAYAVASQPECIATSFYRFRDLHPPPGCDWCEPCPVVWRDRELVFLTERQRRGGRSRIAVIEHASAGQSAPANVGLGGTRDFNYPCAFTWQDALYLVPGQPGGERVALYRCIELPGRWEVASVLLDGVRAANPTIAEVDGTWWLFVNQAVAGASLNDELHLYHAPTPLGPWKAHPRNPVKSDVRSALPGGRPFRWNDRLYRPARDCSRPERTSLSIQRIIELSPARYAEVETATIRPRWGPGLLATATMNHAGRITCIDTARRGPFLADG